MVRDEATLKEAVGILITWAKALEHSRDRGGRELGNMVLLAQIMAQAALLRRESRGAHFRTDYSGTSSTWQRHIVLQRENGWPELEPK